MRIIVAIRLKNHIPLEDSGALRPLVAATNSALSRVQPWSEQNTRLNLRWVPGGGRTAILFRSNEPETIPEREGWIGNKNRAWAWSGVFTRDLYETLRASQQPTPSIDESVRDGIGSFALVHGTADTISVYTNAHRSEAMYWAETPDAILFSNSAAVLNLVVHNGEPSYSWLGMAGFLAHGLPATEHTTFDRVTIAPPGAKLISDRKHDIRFELDSALDGLGEGDLDEVADEIASGLVEYAKTLAADMVDVRAAITGGKDSRLVVATLKAAGVNFQTYTSGLPESGEAFVGKQVSNFVQVPHNLQVPPIRKAASGTQVIDVDPLSQAWATLRSTGGLGNAFTTLADPRGEHLPVTAKGNFGGQGGEIIRGGWARMTDKGSVNRDDALRKIETRWLNNANVLTPLASEAARLDLHKVFELVSDDPLGGLFQVYVRNRTGRWLATMRHGESVRNSHTTLLINNQMVRKLSSLSPKLVAGEVMAMSVMRRLQPGIESLPFFRDRWSFEADAPSSFYSPGTWKAREPHTAHDQPRANYNWRTAFSTTLSAFFKDYILADPMSPLFDVVDRKKVEAMLSGKQYRAPLAWALFSVQATLNGLWLEPQPPETSKLRIVVPK